MSKPLDHFLLATVGLKISSSKLSPTLTSILGAKFNSPLNNWLDYKSTVILHDEKQSLFLCKNVLHVFYLTNVHVFLFWYCITLNYYAKFL